MMASSVSSTRSLRKAGMGLCRSAWSARDRNAVDDVVMTVLLPVTNRRRRVDWATPPQGHNPCLIERLAAALSLPPAPRRASVSARMSTSLSLVAFLFGRASLPRGRLEPSDSENASRIIERPQERRKHFCEIFQAFPAAPALPPSV